MPRPRGDIDGCRRAHAELASSIAGLSGDDGRRPSLLPGWTIGHVLTHIARNADSVVRRLEGACVDEVVEQYEGGEAGRAAAIAAGAGRSAAELVDDLRSTAARLDEALASCPDDVWDRLQRPTRGGPQPVWTMALARWREVEVHHADLGLGFTPADWSDELLERWLPELVAELPRRGARRPLVAWLTGRGPAPDLPPY